MNKKGVTLVELIVSFAIVCVATIYMFRMVTSVKQIYSTIKKETDSYVDEAYDIRMLDACINKLEGHTIDTIKAFCEIDSMDQIPGSNIYKVSKDTISFFKYHKVVIYSSFRPSYMKTASDIFITANNSIEKLEESGKLDDIVTCNNSRPSYSNIELDSDDELKKHNVTICKVSPSKYQIIVSTLFSVNEITNYFENDYNSECPEKGYPEEGYEYSDKISLFKQNVNGGCHHRFMIAKKEGDHYCYYLRDQRLNAPNNPYYQFSSCGNSLVPTYKPE